VQLIFDLCELEHAAEQVRMEHPGQVYLAYSCLHIAHRGLGGVEDEASGCSASCAYSCKGEEFSVLRKVGLGGREG
jgi:hypothetical protein